MNEIKRAKTDKALHIMYHCNGYEVVYSQYEWGAHIQIDPIDHKSMLPSIYFYNEEGFRIQTTSYGALKPEEIDEVIEGYKTAQATVEELKALIETMKEETV